MTDLPSSFGIEAVECVSEGGRNVTVRVTGRWRRRRPEARGQAMLVVESDAGRQRFMAMPEPPSLSGAAPGTWRMSFSVPAALAPSLPGRTFLQLGGVMVPLPIGEVEILAPDVLDVLDELPEPDAEPLDETTRRGAGELAAQAERLERELDRARREADRLRGEMAGRERRLRTAEQDVHSERALRAEVEQELTRQSRAARHDLRLLHERVDELERELLRMRRAVDEAEHLAAAAEAARADAERRLAERAPPARAEPRLAARAAPRADPSRREFALLRAAPPAQPPSAVAALPQRDGDRAALRAEVAMVEARDRDPDARLASLERELAVAREEVEVQRRRSARAWEAIELVRAELRELRGAPSPAPPAAPSAPGAAPNPAPAADPGAPVQSAAPRLQPVQAEKLTEALSRLRERTPAPPTGESTVAPETAESLRPAEPARPGEPPPPPSRPVRPWLERPFRTLVGRDPTAAGRLVLALLPAQRAADPNAVAYDLVLGDLASAQVTVASESIHVEMVQAARPPAEVDFQLVGDLAGVARFLAAGGLRRRLPSRRRARVRGERRRVSALDRLLRAQLGLADLIAAGVTLDPPLALTLAAAAIEPGWTAGERFTLAHRTQSAPAPGAYLLVRDGKPPLASTEPPHGPVATVVVCGADHLLSVLAGGEARVEGEERPLALVRQWLERAQCG